MYLTRYIPVPCGGPKPTNRCLLDLRLSLENNIESLLDTVTASECHFLLALVQFSSPHKYVECWERVAHVVLQNVCFCSYKTWWHKIFAMMIEKRCDSAFRQEPCFLKAWSENVHKHLPFFLEQNLRKSPEKLVLGCLQALLCCQMYAMIVSTHEQECNQWGQRNSPWKIANKERKWLLLVSIILFV